MASVRDVWYVLVDSQGNLSSADTVLIPPNSHVARFKDAVHAKNSAIMPGIVPLQLEVYANKAARDRKEEPLGVGETIKDHLGALWTDPLAVRVKIGELLSSKDFMVPSRNVNQLRIAEDYDEEWLTEILQCSELPDVSRLIEIVSGPLRIRIPIANPAGLFAHLKFPERPSVKSIRQVFEENTAKHCPNVMERIQQVLFDKKEISTTEVSFHSFWDNVIRDTLVLIFSHKGYYSWDRNSDEATATRNYSPDFVFRLNNVCVFRGEEKRADFDDPDAPRRELIDKLEWSYGQAPYLFGYSVCGFDLYLHAILPPPEEIKQDRPCKKPRISKCSTIELGYFNLRNVAGRLNLFRSLVNISPYLVLVSNLCPRRHRPEYICTDDKRIDFEEKDDGTRIVKKTFPRTAARTRIDHLKWIYDTMKHAGVPNVDSLIGDGTDYVLLRPVGDCLSKDKKYEPTSEKELLQALESVLEALVVLHSIGWMHRDIRWPNVIKHVDSPKWFLIDFDDAWTSPKQNSPDELLSRHEHAGEVFGQTGSHTTSVDIWGVGYLITSCSYRPSQSLFEYGESLKEAVPQERPTAVQVLDKIRHYLTQCA